MREINEVQFTGNVKSWIDEICRDLHTADPSFPFAGAEIEDRQGVGVKRRDLVIRPRGNPRGVALTGEVKLPDRPDGQTPYDENVVMDAHEKASAIGALYFFTWNVNRFVLWETFQPNTRIFDRAVTFWDWSDVADSQDLTRPEIQEALKRRWEEFLLEYAEIYRGAKPFPRRPLDKWFIHLLECALDRPAVTTLSEITRRYQADVTFRRDLDPWMLKNLGVTIGDEAQNDNLKRAAKYSCYIATNRIVFYDALRRKYTARLKPLAIPSWFETGKQIIEYLQEAFAEAQKVTEDYETVFKGEPFGDMLPFLNDAGVDAWRGLIGQVDAYDFTALDYDIIGQIFDGLISPGERHRFGQHYTKSEIVDLINAFCIRSPRAKVLDPACGGGTFLIRSYARKSWLAEQKRKPISHESLLSDIYGADLSAYAVQLSTIGLATRNLVRASNYPRVACTDFFEIAKGKPVFPAGISEKGDKFTLVAPPDFDAIVGNPPYIRQEMIPAGHKAQYRKLCEASWPGIGLSGRSDVHLYFWPYAASFLKQDGYFGFLTSSSWLDVEYGFKLQKWILENFCIVAIMESAVEPWFTDARVATTVTILKRESDPGKRLKNRVRFVQLRRPLADILLEYQSGDRQEEAAERVKDFIETRTRNLENENWRIRLVRQEDLINGLDLSDDEEEDGEEAKEANAARKIENGDDPAARHTGGKWGIHLRAPDVFFELLSRCGDKLVPLGEIAEVRYGVKSGCDAFFFPRDVTEERLKAFGEKKFKEIYNLTPKQAEKLRVCIAGDGSSHLIEAEYLEPIIRTVMELSGPVVKRNGLERKILLVNKPKSSLRETHVFKYLLFGERNPMGTRDRGTVTQKTTVSSRIHEGKFWYDLTDAIRPALCWPKAHQYKHIVARNREKLICNCRLYGIDPKDKLDSDVLHAVLLSTPVILMKFLFGRMTGREGNLDTMVCDAKMMLVPDIRAITGTTKQRLKAAAKKIIKSDAKEIREEMNTETRRNLDDIVLCSLGVTDDKTRKQLLNRIYAQMDHRLSEIRDLELIAQRNRLKAARRGKTTPQSLAADIWERFKQEPSSNLRPFPADFFPRLHEPRTETIEVPEGPPRIREMFGSYSVTVGQHTIPVEHETRAQLLYAVVREGYGGSLALPESSAACRKILKEWSDYRSELAKAFYHLAVQRSANSQTIDQIIADLWRRYHRWSEKGE